RPVWTAVDGALLVEGSGRSVARIVVLEGAHAGEDRTEGSQPGRRAPGILVVAPAHREPNAIAHGHHDARRPDLHVQLVHLARREWLFLVVRMVRAVGQRELRIELPM